MNLAFRLPPGTVLLVFGAEDASKLIDALGRAVVLREEGDGFSRMPDGERQGEDYATIVPQNDQRLKRLIDEVRAEEREKMADRLSRTEAFLSGRPTAAVHPEGQLAAVLPHRRCDDAPEGGA